MTDPRDAALPPSRRDFVPAPEHRRPADWRTALRARAPRCGIGVAIAAALIAAALFNEARTRTCPTVRITAADGTDLSPCNSAPAWHGQPWTTVWAVVFVLSLLVIPVLVGVIRRQRRSPADDGRARP